MTVSNADAVRQVNKMLDVLRQVEVMMNAEATMNATKHMSAVVRPVPLAGAVSAAIGDGEAFVHRWDE